MATKKIGKMGKQGREENKYCSKCLGLLVPTIKQKRHFLYCIYCGEERSEEHNQILTVYGRWQQLWLRERKKVTEDSEEILIICLACHQSYYRTFKENISGACRFCETESQMILGYCSKCEEECAWIDPTKDYNQEGLCCKCLPATKTGGRLCPHCEHRTTVVKLPVRGLDRPQVHDIECPHCEKEILLLLEKA